MPNSAIQQSIKSETTKVTGKYPYHYATHVHISASADVVFAFLDDPMMLTGHMKESSWKMGGGSMQAQLDARKGQAIGSVITLNGRALGLTLSVSESVTERSPPYRKAWQTFGTPNLLIIGHYRMGFELSPDGGGTALTVFIDYALPPSGFSRLMARLFGRMYAQWCTEQMASDAKAHFR